jgi:translation initiation factor IF-2
VELAADTGAVVLAFGVKLGAAVTKLAERLKTRVLAGRVIYALLDEVLEVLADRLAPGSEEELAGVAQVKARFELNNKARDVVAGCVVVEGTLAKAGMACYRVQRLDGATGEYRTLAEVPSLTSLMHLKDKVEKVEKGTECGVALPGFGDFVVGDRIVGVRVKQVRRKLNVRFD